MRDSLTSSSPRSSDRKLDRWKLGSWTLIFPFVWAVALVQPTVAEDAKESEDTVQFNRDIRPILSENCFHCHGPDDENREAGLHLDTEEGAKDWAIVEGDWEDSEVW
ncbi:c-type cytochrome domain-containing protein, partial [Rhodopirellula bahusiensis]